MAIAVLTGVVLATLLPSTMGLVTRALFGWNVGVWFYLALIVTMMLRADHTHLRRVAAARAEGAPVVMLVVVLAAMVSLAGIVAELSAAKVTGTAHAWPHLLFALVTVVGSWLLIPIDFTLTYASLYYAAGKPGLAFPDHDPKFEPHYSDFMYFAFTIAVAAQTADIAVTSPAMRRLVLLHAIVSFAFNTAILAFTINVAASMF
ncbi:MAG: DUF1345 domain-containing protein [Betaproteobacteria bacterium]